jgi:hypothetical protein
MRGAQQEAEARERWQVNKRLCRCWLMGGGAMTGGSGSMRGRGAGGWEATSQPVEQEKLDKRRSCQRTGGGATTSQMRGVG